MILIYTAGAYSDHYVDFVDCDGWTEDECQSLRSMLEAQGDETLTVHGIVESVAWWEGELTPASNAVLSCEGKKFVLRDAHRPALAKVESDLDQAVERHAQTWKNATEVQERCRKEDEAFVGAIRKFLVFW